MARVAFIGLGTMGLPMARRLVEAGHELVACDVDAAHAASLGTATAGTPAEAAAGADVAVTSLPSPAIVEQVVLGPEGIAAGARPGTTVIEMSTSPPALAQHLFAELGRRGIDCLDAPVSGGPTGAEAGTLAIMVGGREDVFGRHRDLLAAMGTRIVWVGEAGAGQTVKLCNNLIAGVEMVAISEACAILESEEIDPVRAFDLFTSSTSDSSVMRRRFPIPGVRPEHPSSRGYEPMFTIDLIDKDLVLALELAARHGIDAATAERAKATYEAAQAAGLGGLDYSAVYKVIRPD